MKSKNTKTLLVIAPDPSPNKKAGGKRPAKTPPFEPTKSPSPLILPAKPNKRVKK